MIYAIDFDGTLCTDEYPEIGYPIEEALNAVRELHKLGHTIIIWTCRHGEHLKAALAWLDYFNVPYDYVNENVPWLIEKYGDCRKIYADRYIDSEKIPSQTWESILREARDCRGISL